MKEQQGRVDVFCPAPDGQGAPAADKKHLILVDLVPAAVDKIIATAVRRGQQSDVRWTFGAFVGSLQVFGVQIMIVVHRRSDLVKAVEHLRHSMEDHFSRYRKNRL